MGGALDEGVESYGIERVEHWLRIMERVCEEGWSIRGGQ